MKKLSFISLVFLFLLPIEVINKENLYLFTDIKKCKSCHNEVLNALYTYSSLFDTLNIDYTLILKCRRHRDLVDYKHYFKLDSNLKIEKLTDSLASLYKPKSTSEFFVLTKDDSIIFKTESLYFLIGFISK